MNNLKFFGGGFPLAQAPFDSVMFTSEQSEGIYSYAVASVPLGCYAPSSHSASPRGAIGAHSLDYHKGSKRPVCSLYIAPRDRAVYHARLGEHITQESTPKGCFLALLCPAMQCPYLMAVFFKISSISFPIRRLRSTNASTSAPIAARLRSTVAIATVSSSRRISLTRRRISA